MFLRKDKTNRRTFRYIYKWIIMTHKDGSSLLSIPDADNIAKGMMFSQEYLVYSNFELLKLTSKKIHIGFVGMAFVTEGRISVTLNGVDVLVKKGEIMLFKKGDFLSDTMFSVDSDGWIFITSEILTIANKDSRTFSQLYALQADRRVFEISEGLGSLIVLHGKIAEEKFRMGYFDIRLTLISLANDIIQNLLPKHIHENVSNPTAAAIYKRFNALLMEASPKPREVKWYAEKLGVTPKYLTTIAKRLSGRCVSEWINEAVLADIRRLMIHTEESMKGIAVAAGFNNPAFFGKYVKQHTGMTPMELRAHLRSSKRDKK